jgi:hypothetical protein
MLHSAGPLGSAQAQTALVFASFYLARNMRVAAKKQRNFPA